MARRLPIYVLIGTSKSMYGEPIEAVKNGLQLLVSTLQGEPYALETAYISVITFDDIAKEIVPLTEIASVQMPTGLEARGARALGAALKLLARRIHEDLVKPSVESKGDWAPLVFIILDGPVSDDLASGVKAIKDIYFGNIVCCALGQHASVDELKSVTENVLQIAEADATSIRSFVKWESCPIDKGEQEIINFHKTLIL